MTTMTYKRFALMILLVAAAGSAALAAGSVQVAGLEPAGDRFSFAIFADPQVGNLDGMGRVEVNARRTQTEAIDEINAMRPQPAFAVFNGDLVNVPNESSFENFSQCIAAAQMPRLLVHGNHDTRPPYDRYLAYQQKLSGFQAAQYSWDLGRWHFVTFPCNVEWGRPQDVEAEAAFLAFLEADLKANPDRPTMVFEHLPLLPIGLSQLEWYTYRLELRQKLMDILTRCGNVKYVFCGHVHNGIKASVKTSWEYQGIKFVNVPTIIEGRNFAEEYPAYAHGLPTGGFYMMVHVDGADVTLDGRLVGVDEPYRYPDQFATFRDEIEPRWWQRAITFTPHRQLVNGGFEADLDGWSQTYRYRTDEDPAFYVETTDAQVAAGDTALHVHAHAKGRTAWANDDNMAVYQMVAAPERGHPVLRAQYYLPARPENGGVFIRFNAMAGDQFKFLMMFHVSENAQRADYLPRCIGYEIHGRQQSWSFLQQMGAQNKGFFFTLPDDPDTWHTLVADIADLYDRAVDQNGAYAALGITKFYLSIGTWCNKQLGSRSDLYVDDVTLAGVSDPPPSRMDDRPIYVTDWVHRTLFGQELQEWVEAQENN